MNLYKVSITAKPDMQEVWIRYIGAKSWKQAQTEGIEIWAFVETEVAKNPIDIMAISVVNIAEDIIIGKSDSTQAQQ